MMYEQAPAASRRFLMNFLCFSVSFLKLLGADEWKAVQYSHLVSTFFLIRDALRIV